MDHTIMYYMMPTAVQKSAPAQKKTERQKDYGSKWESGKQSQKWSVKQNWKKSAPARSGGGTGKLPMALKGCASATADGRRLCFAYNIDGCDQCGAGEECSKGWHLCATKGCEGAHPRSACPKKK